MRTILDQKKEIDFTIDPYYLSLDLSRYWNEEIPETQLIPQTVQILRDLPLFPITQKITKELIRRIEEKISYILKMLKGSAKCCSPADPIDRDIYRFARLVHLAIDGGYYWTANKVCFSLEGLSWRLYLMGVSGGEGHPSDKRNHFRQRNL